MNVLLDTGSRANCVDHRWLRTIPHELISLSRDDPRCFIAANSGSVIVEGKVNLPVKIGSRTISQKFWVIANLSVMCLMGLESFTDLEIQCNYKTGTVQFLGGEVEENLIRSNEYLGILRIAKAGELKPHTINRVPVSYRNSFRGGKEICPLPSLGVNVKIMETWVEPNAPLFYVTLINDSDRSIFLKNFGPVAHLKKATEGIRRGYEWPHSRQLSKAREAEVAEDTTAMFEEAAQTRNLMPVSSNQKHVRFNDQVAETNSDNSVVDNTMSQVETTTQIIELDVSDIKTLVKPSNKSRIVDACVGISDSDLSDNTRSRIETISKVGEVGVPDINTSETQEVYTEYAMTIGHPIGTHSQPAKIAPIDKHPNQRTFDDLGLQISNPDIPSDTVQRFRDLQTKYSDIYAMKNSELTPFNLFQATLELKDPKAPPVRGRIYHHSLDARREVERQVHEMLEDGFIQRASSPYAVGAFLVKKSNGKMRLVYDMRTLNSQLKDDIFLPGTLQDCVQQVADAEPKYFSSWDLRAAFNQIEVRKSDRHLLAFTVCSSTYSHSRLPFGCKTSPSIMCKAINTVIESEPLLRRYIIYYVDDLVLFTPTLELHYQVMELLFRTLRRVSLHLSPEKTSLLCEEITFIGHQFSRKGIRPDPKKISTMNNIAIPRSKKELKSVLGLFAFYRNYLPGYSQKTAGLQALTGPKAKFVWTTKETEAFLHLKQGMCNLPTLAYPDETPNAGRFIITTDASNMAVAGTISQMAQDGKSESLIACFGRKLQGAETRWSINEIETLAVIIALQKFRYLFIGKPLIIRTDNMTARFLQTLSNATAARLQRWATYLSDIINSDLVCFEHIKGSQNVVVDCLSRQDYKDGPEEPVTERELEVTSDDILFAALLTEPETRRPTINAIRTNQVSVKPVTSLQQRRRPVITSSTIIAPNEAISADIEYLHDPSNNEDQRKEEKTWLVITEHDQYQWQNHGKDSQTKECSVKNPPNLTQLFSQLQEDTLVTALTQETVETDSPEGTLEDPLAEVDDSEPLLTTGEDDVNDEMPCETDLTRNPQTLRGTGVFLHGHDTDSWLKHQSECPQLKPMIAFLTNGSLPADEKHARRILLMADAHYLNTDGMLCMIKINKNKKESDLRDAKDCIVVPKVLRPDILSAFHTLSHYGMARMLHTITMYFTWSGISVDIRNYVHRCSACTCGKRGMKMFKAELKPLPIPTQIHQTLNIDCVGPLISTSSGNNYILSIIDAFSNYVWFFPVPDLKSETLASKLLQVLSQTGLVTRIISDQGTSFVSDLMTELWTLLKIKRITVSPYRSAANGRVERSHRCLNDALRTTLSLDQFNEWDKHIPLIEMSLRAASTPENPFSPYLITHGMEMRTFSHVEAGLETTDPEPKAPISEYVRNLQERMKAVTLAHTHNKELDQMAMKQRYDTTSFPHPVGYKVGDLVWVRDTTAQNLPRRFQSLFKGPMVIVEIMGTHTVRLKNLTTGKMLKNTTHINALKPYRGPEIQRPENAVPEPPMDQAEVQIGQPDVFVARQIIGHKKIKGKDHYLVDWAPIDGVEQENTWEPAKNCNQPLLEAYNKR